jgi:VCBS repeat-containing protein
MAKFSVTETITIPADFAGSAAHVEINPTSTFVLTVKKGTTSVGTISISTSGTFTWSTSGTPVSLASGDYLSFIAQSSVDATLANVSISVKGTL